jgi:hypothetical protein
MDPNYNPNTDIALRGPLLAAHRRLRKAVGTRCAELKGECSAAAWARRQAGVSGPPGAEVCRPLFLSQELAAALSEFGGPGLIPQTSGFVEYLRGQQRKLTDGATSAANNFLRVHELGNVLELGAPVAPASGPVLLKAQVRMDAYMEFAQLFGEAFASIMSLIRGRP